MRWSSAPASPACTCSTACASWDLGARLRGGRRRRRHLVLEPLSRCALRRREHRLLVLLLARSSLHEWEWTERYPAPAGDAALPQSRRRPLRPAPRHPARTRVSAAALRRDGRRWEMRTDQGDRVSARFFDHGHRLPVGDARRPTSRGSRRSRASGITPGAWPASKGRLQRQASRGHRHGLVGDPGDPRRSPKQAAAPVRLPAHAELQRPRPQPPATTDAEHDLERYDERRSPCARPASAALAYPGNRQSGARGRRRGARGGVRGALAAGGLALYGAFKDMRRDREANETAAAFIAARSARRSRTRRSRSCYQGLPDRRKADLRRHRLLRDAQPRQRARWST